MENNAFQYNCISNINIGLEKKAKLSNKHNYLNLGEKEISCKYFILYDFNA